MTFLSGPFDLGDTEESRVPAGFRIDFHGDLVAASSSVLVLLWFLGLAVIF